MRRLKPIVSVYSTDEYKLLMQSVEKGMIHLEAIEKMLAGGEYASLITLETDTFYQMLLDFLALYEVSLQQGYFGTSEQKVRSDYIKSTH